MRIVNKPCSESGQTDDEDVDIVRRFANGGRAKVIRINGMPPEVYNNTKAREVTEAFDKKFKAFLAGECEIFFNEVFVPMLKERGWVVSHSHIGIPILIGKNDEGEWDNVPTKEGYIVQYTIYRFICDFTDVEHKSEGESWEAHVNALGAFWRHLPDGLLENSEYYLEEVD